MHVISDFGLSGLMSSITCMETLSFYLYKCTKHCENSHFGSLLVNGTHLCTVLVNGTHFCTEIQHFEKLTKARDGWCGVVRSHVIHHMHGKFFLTVINKYQKHCQNVYF